MNVVELDVRNTPISMEISQTKGTSLPDVCLTPFEPILSAVEVCQLLKLHPVTLLRWAREGRVPHLRLGRRVLFRLSQLNVWLTSNETNVAVSAA
jgi:excisionase family DNA binding protein